MLLNWNVQLYPNPAPTLNSDVYSQIHKHLICLYGEFPLHCICITQHTKAWNCSICCRWLCIHTWMRTHVDIALLVLVKHTAHTIMHKPNGRHSGRVEWHCIKSHILAHIHHSFRGAGNGAGAFAHSDTATAAPVRIIGIAANSNIHNIH